MFFTQIATLQMVHKGSHTMARAHFTDHILFTNQIENY